MPDYDYGNARLRVMKSRLLSQRALEALAESDTVQSLIVALLKTPYRKAIETSLTHTSGLNCILDALQLDLIETTTRIRQFYREKASEMVARVLRRYDIHNIKAILRGLGKNAPPGEISSTLLPIGDLSYSLLGEIGRASGLRAAIDLLASLNLPMAQPLIRLRGARPNAEVPEMEIALDKWYFQQELKKQKGGTQEEELFHSALQLDADIINLLTVLRFVHAPAEKKLLRERFGTENIVEFFVGPGRIPFQLLETVVNQSSLSTAVELLTNTPYSAALRAGLESFAKSGRLSDFEKQLERMRLQWLAQWIVRDSLGIGMLLGYLALKVNEIRNLRWISMGINLGLNKERIYQELFSYSSA